jgi:large subunit ribosomal protein L28e
MVKRNGLYLSSEPNNLMNKHSFKYSGIANLEAVGMEENESGKGVTLKTKNKKNSANPKKNYVATSLKVGGFRKVAASIKSRTEGKFYRKDLSKPALARWYKVWKSQQRAADAESSE